MKRVMLLGVVLIVLLSGCKKENSSYDIKDIEKDRIEYCSSDCITDPKDVAEQLETARNMIEDQLDELDAYFVRCEGEKIERECFEETTGKKYYPEIQELLILLNVMLEEEVVLIEGIPTIIVKQDSNTMELVRTSEIIHQIYINQEVIKIATSYKDDESFFAESVMEYNGVFQYEFNSKDRGYYNAYNYIDEENRISLRYITSNDVQEYITSSYGIKDYSEYYSARDNQKSLNTGRVLDGTYYGVATDDDEYVLYQIVYNIDDAIYIVRKDFRDGEVIYSLQVSAVYFDGWDMFSNNGSHFGDIVQIPANQKSSYLELNGQEVLDINGLDYTVSLVISELYVTFILTEETLDETLELISEVFLVDGERFIEPFGDEFDDFMENPDDYIDFDKLDTEVDEDFLKEFFKLNE